MGGWCWDIFMLELLVVSIQFKGSNHVIDFSSIIFVILKSPLIHGTFLGALREKVIQLSFKFEYKTYFTFQQRNEK